MANPFVHVEPMTGDVDKAKAFYGALFDWKLEDIPGMNYTIVQVAEGTGGGMMACPGPEVAPQWLPYILVQDVAEKLAKGRSLGATVMKEVTGIPGMGWFGVPVDPGCAAFALRQPRR